MKNTLPRTGLALGHDARIEAALARVNGRADAHTTTTAEEVRALASEAERRLESMEIPKKHRAGVTYTHSADLRGLPNSYGSWLVVTTKVVLLRNKTSWRLMEVERCESFAGTCGFDLLRITDEQRDIALRAMMGAHSACVRKVETP